MRKTPLEILFTEIHVFIWRFCDNHLKVIRFHSNLLGRVGIIQTSSNKMFTPHVAGNKYFDWSFKLHSSRISKGNADLEDTNLSCARAIVQLSPTSMADATSLTVHSVTRSTGTSSLPRSTPKFFFKLQRKNDFSDEIGHS